MESGPVDALLFENFAGIRMDGSNATIIGNSPGEFKADRNNIPRVWMDHGAWPLLTTRLYIDQTGDLAFLLREQSYFKDHLLERAQSRDSKWEPSQGTYQRTQTGEIYRGTVLEHLLVQHLTAFYNVGAHNIIRLEGGDWNDGMDMAAQRGESVAFSAMYASNLRQLGELAQELQTPDRDSVQLAAELVVLLDTLHDPIPYESVEAKQQRLQTYFNSLGHTVSGKTIQVRLSDLAADCFVKADWLAAHIREQEWISDKDGHGWFNGYYDNDGHRLEGQDSRGVRMTLTGQVFPLMGDIATDAQAEEMIQSIDRYLFDEGVGGYRLNTELQCSLVKHGSLFWVCIWAQGKWRHVQPHGGNVCLCPVPTQICPPGLCRVRTDLPAYNQFRSQPDVSRHSGIFRCQRAGRIPLLKRFSQLVSLDDADPGIWYSGADRSSTDLPTARAGPI